MSIEKEMTEVLKNEIPLRHSYFQLRYFVIGKEPTHQAKMWQCLRELKARKESISAVNLEIEETKDRIELLQIQSEKEKFAKLENFKISDLLMREKEINIRRFNRQITSLEESLKQLEEKKKWLEEEAKFFLDSFKILEKTEKLSNYDDVEVQNEYWNEKLKQELNLKLLLHSPLDNELIKTVLALNDELPIKKQVANMLDSIKAQLEHK